MQRPGGSWAAWGQGCHPEGREAGLDSTPFGCCTTEQGASKIEKLNW